MLSTDLIQKKKLLKNLKKPDSIYGISKYAGEMFIRHFQTQLLKNIQVFVTYGLENLNYLKKGMVSIYCSYVWKKKPIIVKGSLNRFRNYQFIYDVVNILTLSLKNKQLNKNEIINLSNGEYTTVKNLIKKILKLNYFKK